ncbi:MAG: ATP-binding cassette domain-containing protein [Anaerolineae bacterium]|nr:ATP-binding cassette domain-containing protein [Anaerolineae bacterium]
MDIAALDRWAVQGESPWHRAAPLAKIGATALFIAAVVMSRNVAALVTLYLALAALMAVARLPLRRVLIIAAYPALFAVLFAVSRWDGTWQAPAVVILKAVGAAMAMVLLITTTPYPDLFAALSRVLPRLVSDALFMTYRSFFLLLEGMDHLITALRLRGGLQRRKPVRTVQNLALALGVLLIHALDLSQRLYDVLLVRGYRGRFPSGQRWRQFVARRDVLPLLAGLALLMTAWAWQGTTWPVRYPLAGPLLALGLLISAILWRREARPALAVIRPSASAELSPQSVWTRDDVRAGRQADAEVFGHEHPELAGEIVAHISCVKHTYSDATVVSLCGLGLAVAKGERAVVLGPNGSGKSTLLFHLLGLLRPDEGAVRLFGKDPAREWAQVSQRVGVVLQNVDEQILAPTVFDDVAFSPRNYGYPEGQVQTMVEQVMAWLGITHLRDKVPHYLSGGEKRKVAMAGALVLQPELLIMDEPFEGLDPRARSELIALLNRLHSERETTMIVTTHDINTVPLFADSVHIMVAGEGIVERDAPHRVFSRAALLARSNIEPPVLAQLFQSLRECGLDLGHPQTVVEATEMLTRWLQKPTAPAGVPGL